MEIGKGGQNWGGAPVWLECVLPPLDPKGILGFHVLLAYYALWEHVFVFSRSTSFGAIDG